MAHTLTSCGGPLGRPLLSLLLILLGAAGCTDAPPSDDDVIGAMAFATVNEGMLTLADNRQVRLDRTIEVSTTEITQGQYLAVMDDNPSWHRGAGYPDWTTRPVEHVTLYEAIVYCNELSRRLGLTPYYIYDTELRDPGGSVIMGLSGLRVDRDATGYRLPSPGEWEYVCRAGTTTDFHTGDLVGDGKSCTVSEPAAERAGWYCTNTRSSARPQGETKSVGQKEANAFGVYDIHGNVWEWCYDASAMSGGDIVRGGSWINTPFDAKASATVLETWTSPCDGGTRYMNVGFRVVRGI